SVWMRSVNHAVLLNVGWGRYFFTVLGGNAGETGIQWLQHRLDTITHRSECWWQCQLLTPGLVALISVKAPAITGDLVKHSTWLTEVHGKEVEAVDLVGHLHALLLEVRVPLAEYLKGRSAEADVVHTATAI